MTAQINELEGYVELSERDKCFAAPAFDLISMVSALQKLCSRAQQNGVSAPRVHIQVYPSDDQEGSDRCVFVLERGEWTNIWVDNPTPPAA